METISLPANKKIILFDGVCNLCNSAVNFVIARDENDVFRFASLQSDLGKKLVIERGIDPKELNSVILIEPGVAYFQKSTAALKIAGELKGSVSLLKHLLFLPEGLRNFGYEIIAKNRYRWFGKKDACMIPTPDLKAKFLY